MNTFCIKAWAFFLFGVFVPGGLPPLPSLAGEIVIRSHDQFQYARDLMEREEYDLAIQEFERFIHFFPDDRQVLLAREWIGICYMKKQRYEEARNSFAQLIRSRPDSHLAGRAMLLMGETYYEQRLPREARHYFEQIIETRPPDELRSAAWYRLGWTRMMENQWQEASREFSRVDPESPFYQSALALSQKSLEGEYLPSKDPVLAGVLAGMLPGLGHAYVTRYKDAVVAFLLNGLFIWAAVESFHHEHYVLGGILVFFELGWYGGNIYSAVNAAHKWNRKVQDDFRDSLLDRFDVRLLTSRKGPEGLMLSFRF